MTPTPGTPEHKWWTADATAEAQAHRENRTKDGLQTPDFVDRLAQH